MLAAAQLNEVNGFSQLCARRRHLSFVCSIIVAFALDYISQL